ncbi:MAG: D-2-hydroxyacid dehydrogenase [Lysobacterales bacterium]
MEEQSHVVFLDRGTLGPEVTLRKPSFDHQWMDYSFTEGHELVPRAQKARIIVLNKVPMSAEILVQLPQLKLVAVAATGVDVIDLAACKEAGVAVCNVRDYATTSVPEHILSVMFSLRRRLPAYQRRIVAGDWQASRQFCFFDQPIVDLANSTLGIVGTGSIGTALGDLASALGMQVVYHSLSGRALDDRNVLPLEQLLETADVVSLNCPLTDASRNLMDASNLKRMKSDALLINTARGAMVDMHALETALISGRLGGAGIDVCDAEPPDQDDPVMRLVHLDNVIVTPHSAWASRASMQTLADQLIDAIEAFEAGRSMNRLV